MVNDSNCSKQSHDAYAPQINIPIGPPSKSISGVPPSQLALNTDIDKSNEPKKNTGLIAAAAAHAAVPTWTNMVLMASLILGGCCANVSTSPSHVNQ